MKQSTLSITNRVLKAVIDHPGLSGSEINYNLKIPTTSFRSALSYLSRHRLIEPKEYVTKAGKKPYYLYYATLRGEMYIKTLTS